MFKILKCSTTGVTEYCCTKEEDIEKLPKRGLSIGSTAQLINHNGLRMFMFTQENEDIDGQWIELGGVTESANYLIDKNGNNITTKNNYKLICK